MRLSDSAKKRMSQMDAASQRATSRHFDQTYRNVRAAEGEEVVDVPPTLTVVANEDTGGGGESKAPAKAAERPAKTRKTAGKAATKKQAAPPKEPPAAVPDEPEASAPEPQDTAAPAATPPAEQSPAAAEPRVEDAAEVGEERPAPAAEIGPTEAVPTSERRKYTIDITPELRSALVQLLIRDVEAGRKVAQWQHADAAITHFLPEPTEVVPKHGDTWTEFGIALTHENRKRAELLKLRLKMEGRSVPFRCYIAEAIRRYIEAMAPDLAKDLPR